MNLNRYRIPWLVVCLTLVGLLVPLCSSSVIAQGTATMQVGVVEFRNDSGVQGTVLARAATDAVVIELSKSNRFDVITRAQIDSKMKELGVKPPLSGVELSRLADELAAEAMIEGSVKAVDVRGSQAARTASVTLVIRMTDQSSGEVINGAIQRGVSQNHVGEECIDDDTLIAEALNNAAFLAVKTMVDYIIPEATVQNTVRTNEVLLNKGARDGLRSGMRMIVTRNREVIGELNVGEVDPLNSVAAIVKQTRGIRPEDKARAVFDMPTIERSGTSAAGRTGTSPSKAIKNGSSKLRNFLIGLGIAVLAYQLFKPHGETVGSVIAQTQVDPVGQPGVLVSWDSGSLGKGLNISKWNVYRDGSVLVGSVTAQSGLRSYLDTTATVGVSHQYFVSATYIVNSATGGSTGTTTGSSATIPNPTVGTQETELKAATGPATPIGRLTANQLTLPVANTTQDLNKVTFQWQSLLGADTYIVEASTDPTFSNPQFISSTVTFLPRPAGQTVTLVVSTTLFTLFKNVPNTTPIYWRVGARTAGDSPGPVPPPGRANYRYIYSEPSSFLPVAPVGP